ncbi:MAG: TPM domain-containing protein [Bacteroidaceae bacterium]|nr:TPM domain-containing protein [Bacteroidaceae bacterium]
MNIPFSTKKTSPLKGCLLIIVAFFAVCLIVALGDQLRGNVSPGTLLLIFAVVAVAIIATLNARTKGFSAEIDSLKEKRKELIKIGDKYNEDVKQLEEEYRKEKKSTKIRQAYSDKYDQIYDNYRKESTAFIDQWNSTHSNELRLKGMWNKGMKTCFITLLAAAGISMGIQMGDSQPNRAAALMESRMWNADNIPMPHMQDATKYVSNPDSILSPAIVDSIDHIMYRLDTNLGIESAVVIVGHIEGDDPIPMIRGIYEKYKVGRDDRGLVIVVGYLDHSYFIAPGRNLEGDLTDLETNHLAQDYLIPSMRAELPDSGMLYLARGIYALMANKDMPRMSALASPQNDDEGNSNSLYLILYSLSFVALLFYSIWKSKKLGWAGLSYPMFIAANPFAYTSSGSSGSYSGGGGSWGGGSSGGGYGGGSWGGGGSGGRW